MNDPTIADFQSVPVIDFSGMLGSDAAAKQRVATEIRDACVNVGFFYIVNHGIPLAEIDAMFARTAEFFQLPLHEKAELSAKKTEHFCGYVGMLEESADPANGLGDFHEAFDFATEDGERDGISFAGDYRQVSNVWPQSLPEFRETMTDYALSIRTLSRRIFSAFALSLGLPENHFEGMTDRAMAFGRILYYPSQDGAFDETRIGNGAHTDHECFTILCQDKSVQALQVRNKAGMWIDAPPIPGSFVVNIGDLMARWTNGMFASTLHRVANRSGRARYSIPFFIGTNPEAMIEVLPSCVSAERPARYAPIRASDYIQGLIATHLNAQPAK